MTFSEGWKPLVEAHIATEECIRRNRPRDAYKEQLEVAQHMVRLLPNLRKWIIPALNTVMRDLRDLAVWAERSDTSGEPVEYVEEAARTIHRAFTSCLNDRGPQRDSRLWGIYPMASLLFSAYAILEKENNCKSIIRAISAAGKDVPALEITPRSHQVTYRYYLGVIAFREGDETKAEEEFSFALRHCLSSAHGNIQRILRYLVPLRLLRGILPAPALLRRYPSIQAAYGPLLQATRAGRVGDFDRFLEERLQVLARSGTYLVVEKARWVALRQLCRRVWLASDRIDKIPLSLFSRALEVADVPTSPDETECVLANLIYRVCSCLSSLIHHRSLIAISTTGLHQGLSQPWPPVRRPQEGRSLPSLSRGRGCRGSHCRPYLVVEVPCLSFFTIQAILPPLTMGYTRSCTTYASARRSCPLPRPRPWTSHSTRFP
jgi:hypothetical protein